MNTFAYMQLKPHLLFHYTFVFGWSFVFPLKTKCRAIFCDCIGTVHLIFVMICLLCDNSCHYTHLVA